MSMRFSVLAGAILAAGFCAAAPAADLVTAADIQTYQDRANFAVAADAKAACEERTEALREQLRVLERELAAMP